MPLPKEYFNSLEDIQAEDPLQNASSYSPNDYLYPNYEDIERVSDSGNVLDFLGSALWGGASGLSWGVSAFAEPESESWERMNSAQRAGKIVGEGLSLFAPWGPFGLMAKGSRAIGAVATKAGVRKVAKTAVNSAVAKEGFAGATSKIGKIAKEADVNPESIISGLQTKFSREFVNSLDDDAIKFIQTLEADGAEALVSKRALEHLSGKAVRKAFTEAGIEEIAEKEVNMITKGMMEGLKEGRYINDAAHWIERKIGGELPGPIKSKLATYFSMVVQDFAMMNIHGLGQGAIRNAIKDEHFDPASTMAHSTAMAFGFPLIRAVGKGGVQNISTGVKAYFGRYMKTNYKQIGEKYGDTTLRSLAKLMYSPKKMGDINVYALDTKLKVAGKTYKNISQIRRAVDTLPKKELIELMEKTKGVVSRNMTTGWWKAYREDFYRSIPRIALGTVAMNHWVLDRDQWGNISSEEMASHLIMSAAMVKGKGGWGHKEAANVMADYVPYLNALKIMGVDTKGVEDVIGYHNHKDYVKGLGASFYSHDVGKEIFKEFDKVVEGYTFKEHDKQGYDDFKHSDIRQMFDWYKSMKVFQEDFTKTEGLDIRTFDKDTLTKLATAVEGIRFNTDGPSIRKLGVAGTLVKITKETRDNSEALLKDFLFQAGENFGLEIKKGADDRLVINKSYGAEGEHIGNLQKINNLIDWMSDQGMVTILPKEGPSYSKIVKESRYDKDTFESELGNFIGDQIANINRQFPTKENLVVDLDPADSNYFLDFLKDAKDIESTDRMYRIITNTIDPESKYQTKDVDFRKMLVEMFTVDAGGEKGFLRDIADYSGIIARNTTKYKEGNEKEQLDILTDIEGSLIELKHTFELMKIGGARKILKETSGSGAIDIDSINLLKEKSTEFALSNSKDFNTNMRERVRDSFWDRKLRGTVRDRRAYPLLAEMLNHNLAWFGQDGKIKIQSEEALKANLGLGKVKDNEAISKAYKYIKNILGKTLVEESELGPFKTEDINPAKVLELYKWLGSRQLKSIDLVRDKLELIISGKDSDKGVIQRLGTVVHQLNNIKAIIEKPNEGSLRDSIETSLETLKSLKDFFKGDDAINITNAIRILEGRVRSLPTGEIEAMGGMRDITDPSITDILTQTNAIETQIISALKAEMNSTDSMLKLVNRMERIALGDVELGLNIGDARTNIDQLYAEWNKEYSRIKETEDTITIEELMESVNETSSFREYGAIAERLTQKVNEQVLLNSKFKSINDMGEKLLTGIEEQNKIHHHKRTTMDIARDYGLVNEHNELKPEFKERWADTDVRVVQRVLKDVIREGIYSDNERYPTLGEKQRAWAEFRLNDAPTLMMTFTNTSPIERLKIVAASETDRSIVTFAPDTPKAASPNVRYYSDKGFKVGYIEDSITAKINGKLTTISLDFYQGSSKDNGGEFIQNIIKEAIRSSDTSSIINDFRKSGFVLDGTQLNKLQAKDSNLIEVPFLYMRLSPNDRIVFSLDKSNLRKMDTEYENWFNNARDNWFSRDAERTKFEEMFGDLVTTRESDIRHIAELKMLMPYVSDLGKRSEIKKLVKLYAGDGTQAEISKLLDNVYKRSYLSDGGTTSMLNRKVLDWFAKGHFSRAREHRDIQLMAQSVIDNGWRTLLVNDEGFGKSINNIFSTDIRNISLDGLQVVDKAMNPSGLPSTKKLLNDLITNMRDEIVNNPDELKSLQNSLLDGIKFISERGMKLLMTAGGNYKTVFERGGPNGQKTVIFQVGDGNQMLGKGFAIYHPDIGKYMPTDIDVMIGVSAAKTYDGTSLAGTPIEALPLVSLGKTKIKGDIDWSNLTGSNRIWSDKNVIRLDHDAFGVSFGSKNTDGVVMPSSLVDLGTNVQVKEFIKASAIDGKTAEFAAMKQQLVDGKSLSETLYDLNETEGNYLDSGSAGLAKAMVTYGASADNPLIAPQLIRLLRSKAFDIFGKNVNKFGGEDNFIVPNVLGDLGNPVYADVFGTGGTTKQSRVAARFGGIGLNRNTLSRRIGTDNIGNLNGEVFIITDSNGIDHKVKIKNINKGELDYHSSFYERLGETDTTKGYRTNKKGVIVEDFNHHKNPLSSADKKELQSFFEYLNGEGKRGGFWNRGDGITLRHLVTLLKGKPIGPDKIDSQYIPTMDKFNIELGVVGHAVPVIGHDKGIFRVQKVLDRMNGLVEINSFDLRTILQRDNDGDHFYTHTKFDWENTKAFSNEWGLKKDFYMFDKTRSLESERYVNPFGIGLNKNGEHKAGMVPSEVGFSNHARRMTKNSMLIGQAIGLRNVIGWMNRLGIQFDNKPLLKDLTGVDKYIGDQWKVLEKYYDSQQNTTDKFGGTHEFVDNLINFVFFGDRISGLPKGDKVFDRHNVEQNGIFDMGNPFFNNNPSTISREVFNSIARVMKRVNMVSNDVYDEAGPRTPEARELRKAREDLISLFTNPTNFISKSIQRKISLLRYQGDGDGARQLTSEYLEMFYPTRTGALMDKGKRLEMYGDIINKGFSFDIVPLRFSFKVTPSATERLGDGKYNEFWNKSPNAYKMRRMLDLDIMNTDNFYGKELKGDNYRNASLFVDNIESFVNTVKMFGENPVDIITSLGDIELSTSSFKERLTATGERRAKGAVETSLLRYLANNQYEDLLGSYKYVSSDKYANPEKVNSLHNRILNLRSAIDVLDNQISKGMVVKKDAVIINKSDRGTKKTIKHKFGEADVYMIRGAVRLVDEERANLYSYESIENGKRIDYGMLKYVTRINKDTDIWVPAGNTLIIDKTPMKRQSMSDTMVRYSTALNAVTRGTHDEIDGRQWEAAVPVDFMKTGMDKRIFAEEVEKLRFTLSHSYSKTLDIVNDRQIKALRSGIYNYSGVKDEADFNAFMKKWAPDATNEELMWRYLLMPQYVQVAYLTTGDKDVVPYFKMNKHLVTTASKWAENTGRQEWVKNLIKDVEYIKDNPNVKVDLSAWDRSSMDSVFDGFKKAGQNKTALLSMAKMMGIWWDDPLAKRYFDSIIPSRTAGLKKMQTFSGEKIIMRKPQDSNKKFTDIMNGGNNCGM